MIARSFLADSWHEKTAGLGTKTVARLFVLQGPDKGKTFLAHDEPLIIGRSSDLTIRLNDNTVSRKHAEVRPENGALHIEDLNSANGTYVNGQRVYKSVRLKHGDQIKVGATLLVYTGQDSVQQFTGSSIPEDLIDLDAGAKSYDSAIVSAMPSSEDSVIIAAPEMIEALHAWRVMYQLSEVIGAITSPDELLGRVVDIVFEQVPVDRCFIFMRDDDGELKPKKVRYKSPKQQQAERIAISQRILHHVVDKQEGILCKDAMSDPRFADSPGMLESSIHNLSLRSVICVPIVARDDVMGVIHVDSAVSSHTYTEEQLRLMIAIGYNTGMAIKNIDLLQVRLKTERLAVTGQTVAYLSHYIKNILQGMRSGADLVEMGLKKQKLNSIAAGWSVIQRNFDKIYALTSNMLAFSKDRKPRIELAQFNRVVADAVQLAQGPADQKGVMLLTDFDDSMPAIPIDADGIHQLTLNIVNNAVDAAPPDTGRVTVTTAFDPDAGHAILKIFDNGPGIPNDQLTSIFEPFTSSKGQKGTGLGLAVAKKIVDEHNGTLHVESVENENTTFTVKIPVSDVEITDAAETAGPSKQE